MARESKLPAGVDELVRKGVSLKTAVSMAQTKPKADKKDPKKGKK